MKYVYRARERLQHAAKWAREHPGRVRALATLLVVVLLVGGYLVPFAFGGDARHLSAYADGGEDLSRFRAEVASVSRGGPEPAALATSPHMLGSVDDPASHVLFVFGVERAYTSGETAEILRFVEAGGTLVLANDVSNANRLSAEFGITFMDFTVLDEARAYKGVPSLVAVAVPFAGTTYNVLMNAPAVASFEAGSGVVALAYSSNASFLDTDANRNITVPPDRAGQFPLVMETAYGEGRVLVLADTGLFMNAMLDVPGFDNAAFARALAGASAGGKRALIDESRHDSPPAARAGGAVVRAMVLATSTPVWRVVVATLALGVTLGAVILTRDTEDWSVHEFDIGHSRPAPDSVAPTPERLRALAARCICERYNVPLEFIDASSVDEVARLTGDRDLAAVAKGAARADDPRALFAKLKDSISTQVPVQERAR